MKKIAIINKRANKIVHVKKELAYEFSFLLIEFGIEIERFRIILQKMILNVNNKAKYSERLNKVEYKYLRKIIFTLSQKGFNYEQIRYLFLREIPTSRISLFIREGRKNYLEKKTVITPIEKLEIQYSCHRTLNKISIEKDNLSFLDKLLSTKIAIYSFDGKENFSILQIKKQKTSNREQIKKTYLN